MYIYICIYPFTYAEKIPGNFNKKTTPGGKLLSMGWEKTSFTCGTLELFNFSPHEIITYTIEKLQIFIYFCVLFKVGEKLESQRRKSSGLVSDCFVSLFLWHSLGAQRGLDVRVQEVRKQTAVTPAWVTSPGRPLPRAPVFSRTKWRTYLVKLKVPSSFHVSKVTLSLFSSQLVETFLHKLSVRILLVRTF